MIKKNTDIQIDINSIDKIHLFKVPFDSHKVINITNHIKKKLSILDIEKEKLQKFSSFEKKNEIELSTTKNNGTENLKRKTKKTKKIRPNTNIIKNSSLTQLYSQINNNNHTKVFNLKRISFNKSVKQFSLFGKKNSSKKSKEFFITEFNNKKKSLLHLTSNFSQNNSDFNVMNFNGFSDNNSFCSENVKIISNTSNSLSFNFNDLCIDLNNNKINNTIDYNNNKIDTTIDYNNSKINNTIDYNNNNLSQEKSILYNIKLKHRNIPHPIYKHLNETLQNSKKIKNEIMNLSNSYTQSNTYNNSDNDIKYYEKIIPLEKKEKYFIYNLGYYLFLDPKYKDSLSSTKTVSLLNPMSSFIFKDKIEKKMKIKIKYIPLDHFKILPNKSYNYKFQKPNWVDKKNIQINKGFKNIYKQLEKSKLELKRIKKKHNF